MFGYEKGAFTGAVASKPGKFELADKGTLFLDEIGDVPPATQVKLLRVLQEREFERLGGTRTVKVDVRLIAATNHDLREALEQGTFREDLYYRLNVVPIDIAPLRERKEDIPDLANLFISRFAGESGKPVEGITPEAMQILVNYHWPGNVRELQNIVERACALAKGSVLDAGDIHLDVRPAKAANGAGRISSRRHDAGAMGRRNGAGSPAPRQRQQEPGGAPAGPFAQCAALPALENRHRG